MKEKIMHTALELFSEKGFEAVSVSMISDELGISKGALYKHFASKRDIFDSILKRMEETDFEKAKCFDLPSDIFENMPEAYQESSLEDLFSFTLAMFIYWTEDDFASKFRKMLTVEQYKSPEMNSLYHQYLCSGPLKYVESLFVPMLQKLDTACSARQLALDFYAPVFMMMSLYDSVMEKCDLVSMVREHIENFMYRVSDMTPITYPRSQKYSSPELMRLIMGPNPIKLEEELLNNNRILPGSIVCDLGSGNGLTSVFMANEYGFKVYACDLWSDPEENKRFFAKLGLDENKLIAVKADAMALPFEKEFFDAVVSVDSYNYFGRDASYLDEKLLPFVKSGGYIYIAIPGMKKDCHDNLPEELLLSWNAEQMDFLHDKEYWKNIIEQSTGVDIISIREMRSADEVWNDWLLQDNEYAVGDRKSMEAGAGKYLNFIQIILRKK